MDQQTRSWRLAARGHGCTPSFARDLLFARRIAQSPNEQCKGWGGLTAAWIIEVVAGKRLTPVFQNANQSSAGKIWRHLPLGQIGKPPSFERSLQNEVAAVEHELTIHSHVQLPPAFLEFPSVQSAVTGEAKIDATVTGELLRRPRRLPLREIVRGPGDCHAHRRSNPHCNHVFCNGFARALRQCNYASVWCGRVARRAGRQI
ncbi:hypothetical protein OKW32_002634 [Paraburkholderia youngii]